MTNLFISYPSIPFDAIIRTTNSGTFSSDRPVGNLIYGERYLYGTCTAAASGVVSLDWDGGSGVTTAVNHFIIPNAAKLIAQGTTNVQVFSGTDGVTYGTTAYTDASFASATLYGPDSRDYLVSGVSWTAARAWRTYLSGGAASTRDICKFYLGTAWDPGKEVDKYSLQRVAVDGGMVKQEDGSTRSIRLADTRWQFSATWKGVTDTNARTFYNRICRYWQQHKFFIYTTGNHRILNNMRVMHVRVLNEPTVIRDQIIQGANRVGYNTITCNFQEVRG